jgi:hypothetical protein
LAFVFLASCFPLMDTDFWWHLRTGELILERGLPDLDWYTFTDFDKPWIDLHWGFQLLVSGLWHLGGANLIVLFKAAVYTTAVWIALKVGQGSGFRGQETRSTAPPARDAADLVSSSLSPLPSPLFQAAFWILPAIIITGRAYERPEMLSLVFLAAWLLILDRSEERPRLLWCSA